MSSGIVYSHSLMIIHDSAESSKLFGQFNAELKVMIHSLNSRFLFTFTSFAFGTFPFLTFPFPTLFFLTFS
jgi:hypothetical protein